MPAVAHRVLWCQRRVRSVISMGCRSLPDLLSWRLRDHLVVARAVIMMSVVTGLTMIMLVCSRFREGIADVVRNRLAGTVISAVPYPAD